MIYPGIFWAVSRKQEASLPWHHGCMEHFLCAEISDSAQLHDQQNGTEEFMRKLLICDFILKKPFFSWVKWSLQWPPFRSKFPSSEHSLSSNTDFVCSVCGEVPKKKKRKKKKEERLNNKSPMKVNFSRLLRESQWILSFCQTLDALPSSISPPTTLPPNHPPPNPLLILPPP